MIDFIEYVVSELKSKRLSKTDAVGLVRQYARGSSANGAATIHPLLHGNTSDLSEQRYTSTFGGDEFFLADHQVKPAGAAAQKVLPGVAYLEMARAAVEQALAEGDAASLELQNVVWAQPIVVTGQRHVSIALSSGEGEQIDFEIYSHDGGDEIVHAQGRAIPRREPAPAAIDLAALEAQMTSGTLAPDAVYATCARMGLAYGPSFRSIAEIHRGTGQVLARLRLPASVESTSSDYVLHPSLVDGALQAAVGLLDDGASNDPRLPFALDRLRVVSRCSNEMVAWLRYAPGSSANGSVVKLDIDLCDARGNVCAEMRGFSWRVLSKELAASVVREKTTGTLLAAPVWQEAPAVASATPYAQTYRLSFDAPNGESIAERYSACALAAFEWIQGILQSRPEGKVLAQIVVDDPLLAGLSGLLRTAALENPQFVGQLVIADAVDVAQLDEESRRAPEPLIRYRNGVREVLRWNELEATSVAPTAFKDDGVYLITGGFGGLGTLFTNEILERAPRAHVILTGRGTATPETGARVSYRRLDLGNLEQVREVIAAIVAEHGRLDGILHCAGMTSDAFLLKKTRAEFAEVLAPKVAGTVHLDEATKDLDLDWFVLFSALAGAMGNPGQADYAAANGFLDRFAVHRNQLVDAGQRHGRTRAIDWPLWQDGGMHVDAATEETLRQVTGMQPMQSATGVEAFHRSLALPHDQLLVAEGDLARMRAALLGAPAETAEPEAQPVAVADLDAKSLGEKTQEYLRKQFSGLLKLPAQEIDPRAALENYGIDSILAMKLTNQLEKTFGSLSKTLFFEYQTIRELSEYFLANHAAQLAALFTPAASRTAEVVQRVAKAPAPAPAKLVSGRRRAKRRSAGSTAPAEAEPIAIIGLSGRYPEAADIENYWRNLRDGKDCIVEVPKERWDWREFFSDDRDRGGHHYSKWGGFIEGVDEFDPLFFNISPAEAELMDPQERLFLQHAWMAVEDAGYSRAALQIPHAQDLPGQVGVYVGLMYSEYQLFGAEAGVRGKRLAIADSAGSIANRVSYTLNLHGPSMTLDTMCSSSLSAIHVACQDLRYGRTAMAIAGGVNVSIHPNKYLLLSTGQFISSDGHCQSFGEGGDGYIPGEGVGVVILKRLSDAKRDGDHIYAIIRGSALNHGGKTNGYTVPNPQAQASVIGRALSEAKIDPRHVSYIEAHGTGTKLGDPIEIAALSKAFQQQTEDTGFCLIGSAKSNIGHCESAAGIAGLTKVVLQMQHRQIVPSLHSERLNPHIDFGKTPFVVNQALRPWEPPVVDGRTLPRIAGISSFGAGGSNAHMLLEEYEAPVQQSVVSGDVAIVLSARTPEQLQQKAADLLDYVRPRVAALDLAAVAWTLQAGREPMEERLGFVVSTAEQLAETLQAFLDGAAEDVYVGRVKRNDATVSLFTGDADLQQTVDRWMANGRLAKLLELWVKGLELDWSKLHGDAKPRRVSLPTYPFAKERYWIDAGSGVRAIAGEATALHPLLQRNTSDLSEQRFSSTFTGEEPFLADHRVNGQAILPGVAYLEMARAAVERALPGADHTAILDLRDTVWAQPIVVSEPREISIALVPGDDDRIDYEIYSDGAEPVIHCQGRAIVTRTAAPKPLDLEQLAREMTGEVWDASRLYAACARLGLSYGPSFQSVVSVRQGSGQLLAELRLPQRADGDYTLNPAMLDGALHAAVALAGGTEPHVPFAIESLRIFAPCTAEMRAWVRTSGEKVVKVDVDLCDESGSVCVEMRGLSARVMGAQHSTEEAAPSHESPESHESHPSHDLPDLTQTYLRAQFAEHLKLPAHKIDPHAPLEKYGIDSVLAMKLTNQLEKTFGPLPKTLFFEYQSIAEVAQYLVAQYPAQLASLLAPSAAAPQPAPAVPSTPAASLATRRFSRRSSRPAAENEPIAIIGLSGRYPEAVDVEAYWLNLRDGKDCITEVPKSRWDWQQYFSETRGDNGVHASKWGGFIEGVDEFDPLFFNISPADAELIDPQERLFLQHAWMAVEDAGYTRATLQIPAERDLAGQVGVYVGVMYSEYQLFGAESSARGKRMGVPGSTASIANRVSYALNLHGPSVTLDTMCSSSLTAIHFAAQDLKLGRTSLAIAGGVNVSIHPNKYLVLSGGQFISSDGHCQSFGEGGDGYIPGEGVGVVLLKRLSDAERDGDHIYGVLRASALNHGGKTNGYTVPSPQAQGSVIARALDEARIDARHVSYIEAHGTGTKLGDPIEIAALTKAFQQSTQDTGYCLIGSAKSNIGHCESAAGIAGLTKVLLQMQHRQIVPSLHSAQLNPHIDFEKTPFVVNQSLREWEAPVVDGRTLPRIAGISSFGAGGSNAHLLVEEYLAPVRQPSAVATALIVLSARTPEQLRQKAADLLGYVRPRVETIDVAAVAWTLQTGREAMEERLAFAVTSAAELVEQLDAYLKGNEANAYRGQVTRAGEALSFFSTDSDLQEAIGKWIAAGKVARLLELWVRGVDVDWTRLYGAVQPPRVSLPTYPFAKERYWIDVTPIVEAAKSGAAVLHPLLHRNTSDLSEQRFSSTFEPDALFVADHQLNGQPILPAAAQLEMARAAVERALPAQWDASSLELRNIVWAEPVVVAGRKEVSVALIANERDEIDFEIYSHDGEREIVHGQGCAVLGAAPAAARLDLAQLEGQMTLGRLDASAVYELCARIGLVYGPSLQSIEAVHRGNGELLARLRLPQSAGASDYVLHPSLVDGALQACVALAGDGRPRVPFALDSLRVLAPCTPEMAAWIRVSGEKVDLDLCDASGNVCVQLRGLSARALTKESSSTLLATPVWENAPVASAAGEFAERHVLVCELPDYTEQAVACFERIQSILQRKPQGRVLLQIVTSNPLFAGLSGLLKTAALENPQFTGQLILVEGGLPVEEPGLDPLVRYVNGVRQVIRWQEVPVADAPLALEDDGVYLITGGFGGLGLIFAKDILGSTRNAHVILTGRSPLTADKQAVLESFGGRASYRQLDLCDLEEVKRAVAGIEFDHHRLDGILHCAGMIADRFLVRKSVAEFRDVLAPKVTGTQNLDAATRLIDLDFFVLFSSLAGATGNAGQADYATANGFLDQFAAQRKRSGRTVSINWPLWEAGGMHLDAATLELLQQSTGMRPLPTETGLQAFRRALSLPYDQLLVVEGDVARLRRALVATRPVAPVSVAASDDQLLAKTRDYLREQFSGVLKMPARKIDAEAALEKYGIDSILAMRLTNHLEKTFGSLSKTLFFEYQTIAALAEYFASAHAATLRGILDVEVRPSPPLRGPSPRKRGEGASGGEPASRSLAPRRGERVVEGRVRGTTPRPEIAIVGLAGRYPQAKTLQDFWRNLQDGRDCITEIPAERWDHSLYFDPDPSKAGKSYSKWGGFLDDVDKFDPLFFNISPKEAALIDPQERLFLETAWQTIEDAGYTRESIAGGRVGVYVGVMWGQYELFGAESVLRGHTALSSSSYASVANRVSYFFDLHGPSMALDTMCSSSLTAIHLACEELRKGDIDAALAGGVNLTVHPYKYLSLSLGKFAASDGRCRSFGEGGDGYVPGEGVGAVLLKRLDDALRDGDQIYALVKSSALNHGGKTNGYTVPNPNAQAALVREALEKAHIDPATLSYVETHGTGTSLGDPIEITGLSKAFATEQTQFCPIGSVKSNIGHLESAAGIAAITKALLQIRHKQLVPSLHAEPLNPNIDFAASPFYVQTELAEWKQPAGHPRRAGVSSFGAGGANAHIILEEYEAAIEVESAPQPELFVLSARDAEALRRYAETVADALEGVPDAALAGIAYTSQVGRTAMDVRLAVLASSVGELRAQLRAGEGIQGNVKESTSDLIEGAAGQAFVADLLARRELDKIAKLWTLGVEIDWSLLPRSSRPRRVSLPTYPFAKERCWVDVEPRSGGQALMPVPVEGQARVPVLHYYAPQWTPKPLLSGSDQPAHLIVHRDNDLYALFDLCQSHLKASPREPLHVLTVCDAASPHGAAMSGFLKTLAQENPNVRGKVVQIARELSDSELDALLRAEAADWSDAEVRYAETRLVRELVPVARPDTRSSSLPLRQNGVYLITGGMGGLGLIFAEYLAKRYRARLVLVGRSAPDARKQEVLRRLESLGAEILALQADVARLEDVEAVVSQAKQRFSAIHGVIHAAGVNRDAFVVNKTKEELAAVLAPKIEGAIHLDLATRGEALDLFVLFASLAGVSGNAGQADYAYANRFLDAFAEQRAGRTLSIDWPLWEEGGMSMSPDEIALLESRTGLRPLPTAEGLRAWEDLLRLNVTQAVPLYGVAAAHKLPRPAQRGEGPRSGGEGLATLTETYLKKVIGEEIHLAPERIGSADPLESFGLDSVAINKLNAQLERELGELPKTLFYEHETVRDLAAFLVRQHGERLTALLGASEVTEPAPAEAPGVGQALLPVLPAAPAGDDELEGIAIIGIHGLYPHSATLDEYWENLARGRELVDLVPANRWDREALSEQIYCKWGGFVDDFDKFDPHFFHIPKAEAEVMDPQERLFLESVWSAIEDAGYTRDTLRTRFPKGGSADVGVFVGVTTNSYHLWAADERKGGNFACPTALPWSIANRVSYFFDFNGPSLPVDTACSSSLVAVHLACESLRSEECQVAIAGGVNLYLHPAKYQSLCQRRMLSLDGKTHSYGGGDDGFVPGEGVGTLVLKPLRKAVADRDRIYGVIRASAFDHSGRSNGYSAPNPNSQAALIRRTLEKAHIDPETISYVEGHGTGTQMGDSLEIAALSNAFGAQTSKKQFCAIGSVKANIGHSESAAGVAGLAKVLLQLEHRQLAPSIASDEPNPNIDFDETPFYLQRGLTEWPSTAGAPRRALVNSFGAGGVNACVVVEEYRQPVVANERHEAGPYLFVLSAKNEERLREYAGRIVARLRADRTLDLGALCYTLQAGREAMEERLAAVVSDADELIALLAEWRERGSAANVHRGSLGPRRGFRRSKLLKGGDLTELAIKWAAGEDVEWESLYGRHVPQRTAAPTYPFARERYWISEAPAAERPALATARLHPLIACNSSTLDEVSFSSSLSDGAFYAVDHKVHEERLFPGAAFLEMACVSGNLAGERRVRKIMDVVWMRPLSFRDGTQAVRTVLRRRGEAVEFAISSFGEDFEDVVHSEGVLTFAEGRAGHDDEERVSLQGIKALCTKRQDGAAFYEKFGEYGLHYGPSFRTVQEIHVNGVVAVSKLKVADHLKGEFGQFLLHPALIDGALQTVAGLGGNTADGTPYLPFAVDEIDLLGPVPQTCYAVVELADPEAKNLAGVAKFNIRLLNESGQVLIRFRNLYVRPLAKPLGSEHAAATGRLLRMSEAVD